LVDSERGVRADATHRGIEIEVQITNDLDDEILLISPIGRTVRRMKHNADATVDESSGVDRAVRVYS
jgi:hypothetical protein